MSKRNIKNKGSVFTVIKKENHIFFSSENNITKLYNYFCRGKCDVQSMPDHSAAKWFGTEDINNYLAIFLDLLMC